MQVILSILIPTYNRADFLLKNLAILQDYIERASFCKEVEIVISNNGSTDSTDSKVKEFRQCYPGIKLDYHKQEKNIGLEKNALYALKSARGLFVMYLGDDDYLEFEFLRTVMRYIKQDPSISLVIPNNYAIDLNGKQISKGRDDRYPTMIFESGFMTCLKHSWRGHQLSGLVLRRTNLYDAYVASQVCNIYPFIFFTSYNSLAGRTLHLTEYPVKVTMPGQHNKDWNYGTDGLLNEIFDNYKRIPLTHFQKALLQMKIIERQPFRLWKYRKIGKGFCRAIVKVWFADNAVFLFRLLFPLLLAYMIGRFEVLPKMKRLINR